MATPHAHAEAARPVRVGRYDILGELGRGGMATVYLASQVELDRLVALKRLDALEDAGGKRAQRFVREARLAASLSHPNIVTVHDAFAVDGIPYIAMELVPGGTIRELLVGLTIEQIAGVLDDVLAGLAHAERRNIVHRDIKPENLMVTAEGHVKITDFGIAKATSLVSDAERSLTTAGVAIGTPTYMAPEQAQGLEVDHRTDLYALGIVAFEMLAGRAPFGRAGDSSMQVLLQQVSDPPPPLERLRPGIDPDLAAWVSWLLAKRVDDRPQSAVEARERLEDIVLRPRGPRWRRDPPLPSLPGPLPAPTATLSTAIQPTVDPAAVAATVVPPPSPPSPPARRPAPAPPP